jgi:purine-nucleoside/S-methyl-5'-thioadenosine phosphorylase / adenosine deaminase
MICEPWLERDGITHGFFGRQGGVSTGLFESLNCGYGSSDDRSAITENRARVAAALQANHLLTVHQHHAPTTAIVTEPWPTESPPRADAMVTNRPGLALGILAADCLPILFAEPRSRTIGAAHAGWRGAIGGVIEATIEAMEKLGAARSRLIATVGPGISGPSYEVGHEFHARFIGADGRNGKFFAPSDRSGHFYFDLPAYALARLSRSGIGAITNLGACTYRQETDYFSYRRATHRGEADYGRNVSAILLRP